jgi:hypothetical protein
MTSSNRPVIRFSLNEQRSRARMIRAVIDVAIEKERYLFIYLFIDEYDQTMTFIVRLNSYLTMRDRRFDNSTQTDRTMTEIRLSSS